VVIIPVNKLKLIILTKGYPFRAIEF